MRRDESRSRTLSIDSQTVAVFVLEPDAERVFHVRSYGYRPGVSDRSGACAGAVPEKTGSLTLDVKPS